MGANPGWLGCFHRVIQYPVEKIQRLSSFTHGYESVNAKNQQHSAGRKISLHTKKGYKSNLFAYCRDKIFCH
jgi:hypothetical protein